MISPYGNILIKLHNFEQQLDKILIDSVKKFEAEIIDMNTAQLDAGINGEGNPIEPAYTSFTMSIKRSKGQPTDRVTLEDEGDFKRDFFMTTGKDYFALGSSDIKTQKLERKYGKDIFGLTQENIDAVKDLIRPDVIEALKLYIQ